MPHNRKGIPQITKRKVRKKCEFCCIICGCPIYDYEHIIDYSIVHEHKEENIVLMCPTCHRKKTNHEIAIDQIYDKLIHIKREMTKPEEILITDNKILLGNNTINCMKGYIIKIFDKDYISINSEGLLDADIFSPSGVLAIKIRNNAYELNTQLYDIIYSGGKLGLYEKEIGKFIEMYFDGRNRCIRIFGRINVSPSLILRLDNNGIWINEKLLASNCYCEESRYAGILIDNFAFGGVGFGNCSGNIKSRAASCDIGYFWDKNFLTIAST